MDVKLERQYVLVVVLTLNISDDDDSGKGSASGVKMKFMSTCEVFALLLPASIYHFGRKMSSTLNDYAEVLLGERNRWEVVECSRTGSNCNFSHVQVARKIFTLIYTFFSVLRLVYMHTPVSSAILGF